MNISRKTITGVFSSLMLLAAVLNADDFKPDRTFYVSNSGSDKNDGLSLKTPLQTITKAAQIVKSGDLVLVKGGTYKEQITLKESGTKEKPIIFRAIQGETVNVTWGWDINNWTKIENTRFCYKSTFKYAINMLWERRTLSRYLELDDMELLDKQPGGFFVDKKSGDVFVHAFDGKNPELSGIVAIPHSDGKNPVACSGDISKLSRWFAGFVVSGNYNIVDGFEITFQPTGTKVWKTGESTTGGIIKNNIIYGCTCGIVANWRVSNTLIENNRLYKNGGTGILIGDKVKNIVVKNNYLFNNGPCNPFHEQLNAGSGHSYNLARYGGDKEASNVDFIGNTVISDDPSRVYGVFRCKGGVNGKMTVSENIFISIPNDAPHFYAKPDNVSIIKNNTIPNGVISYEKQTAAGVEYKPELSGNIDKNSAKNNPGFADPSFYDYRLRKDSPLTGQGAYPESGAIFYVNTAAKAEGDGSTPEKALKSLTAAFAKTGAGGCIYILPGNYKENISLSNIGGDKNIAVRNYGKEKVVFENSIFDLKDCRNITFDGIILKNSKINIQKSNALEFLHCIFDGNGIKAENCGLVKVINNTFADNSSASEINASMVIIRNNLFLDPKTFPVKSDTQKTISENNAFSGANAEKILNEWKNKYNEPHSSITTAVKLDSNYFLPPDTTLAFSGLGWTSIGALGTEKIKRPVIIENLKLVNAFSDRVMIQWETPFDYPDVNIICKDKNGKTIENVLLRQGLYKQTFNSECIKGLAANSKYNISFIFTNPGGTDKVEKTLAVSTTEEKTFQPKNIFVSKSGKDSNSGLSGNDSKKSIYAALSIATPGDTILVAPGIYTEQNKIFIDGLSKSKNLILKSEKPGQAVINAAQTFNTSFSISMGKHITIDGFKFSGLRYSSIATAIMISKSEDITIRNCIFERDWKKKEGGGTSNVQLRGVDVKDIEVSNCIFDSGFHGVWFSKCDDIRIFNNVFWHIGINGIHVGCTKDARISIYNNIFEDVVSNHKSPAVSVGEHGEKISCDYNIYWKTDSECPGQKTYGAGGGPTVDSAAWHVLEKDTAATIEDARKMYGVEKNGQFADPMFKDSKKGDFSVKPGSPATGKGRNGSNIGVNMSVFSK